MGTDTCVRLCKLYMNLNNHFYVHPSHSPNLTTPELPSIAQQGSLLLSPPGYAKYFHVLDLPHEVCQQVGLFSATLDWESGNRGSRKESRGFKMAS